MEHKKNCQVTDELRSTVIRLKDANLSNTEIGNILNMANSTVSYIVQVYSAVNADDWETVNRLKNKQSTTIEWALKTLNKVLPEECVKPEPSKNVSNCTIDDIVATQDEILKSLHGIGYMLTQLLEIAKESSNDGKV